MLIVEGRSEQKSKRNLALSRRNVADPFERGIAERIVDCVIVKKLMRSRHRASCHVAQLLGYLPYLIGIGRKKLFYNVNHRRSTSVEHAIVVIARIPWLGRTQASKRFLKGSSLRDQIPFQQAFLFLSYQELTYSPPLIRLHTNFASQ